MQQVPVTEMRAVLRPERRWRLPPAPGVTLRGALLKAVTHMGLAPTWWRGAGRTPAPWWLSVDELPGTWVGPDEPLHVRWCAVGSIPEPTSFVRAFLIAARAGLGRELVPHEVVQTWVKGKGNGAIVVRGHDLVGQWPAPGRLQELVDLPDDAAQAVVRLCTPFVGRQAPTPATWVHAAIGRIRGLARCLDMGVSVRWPEPSVLHGNADVWHERGSRRSGTQPAHRQDLSGWRGQLKIHGPALGAFIDVLAAAEVLQVGRSVTCGQGVVEVIWV